MIGPVWDVAIMLSGIGGSGLTTWIVVSYKLGKRDGENIQAIATLLRERAEDRLQVGKLQTQIVEMERTKLNQFLRVFQAIEEVRRRLGNGDKQWIDLGG
jgi:hypothetical protein